MENPKDLPKRKPLRLRNFDYSLPGLYFITVCTHNKKPTLSRVVGAIHESPAIPDGIVGAIHESPAIQLTPYGKIVDEIITKIPSRFGAYVEHYVIMPNHIHLLLAITDDSQIRAIHESPLRSRSGVSKIVGYLKMNVSKEIRCLFGADEVWQRGVHDHIIRDREDHERHVGYIGENPLRWRFDELYAEQ